MARLSNKVALVTGMAMGIGQSVAELFAAEGAAVIGFDIHPEKGMETRDRIRASGGQCEFYRVDVGSEAAVQSGVQAGVENFSRIDTLVNVVGIFTETPLHQMLLDDWERIIHINLTSAFLTSRQVLPYMLAQRAGTIVHITSVQALMGFPGYPHYAASKGGLISLTRQMAREYGPQGVRVNCIAPGTVITPMFDAVLAQLPDPQARRRAWENMHPVGRLGQPRDIAYGALYLCSDESSFVTGHCMVIDGGASSCAPV